MTGARVIVGQPISFPIQILPLACSRIQHESVCLRLFYSQEKTGLLPPPNLFLPWSLKSVGEDQESTPTHTHPKRVNALSPFRRDVPQFENMRAPLRRAGYVYQDAITLVEADSRHLSFSRVDRKSGESERGRISRKRGFCRQRKRQVGERDGRG